MAQNKSTRTLARHFQCLKCHSIHSQRRTFSSSSCAFSIGPESPNYIDVPKPPQSDFAPKPKLRGFLPVPKSVFTDIRDPQGHVIKEAFERRVAEATIEPSPHRPKALPKHAGRVDYKSRQAEVRRRNLREGMQELLDRKERKDRILEAKSRRTQAERDELVSRPEREDERLTRGSVLSVMLQRGPLPDPNRQQRLEEKRRNFASVQKVQAEHKRDALHTLYMNAQSFITNERQLDEQIEKEFGTRGNERKFGYGGSSVDDGESYWDEGTPPTTRDLLKGAGAGEEQRKVIADLDKETDITQERMRRMAEELTGGKM
ncbi:hypothetical protein EV356DRAFT_322988 [Viridothelium virens]|uniref:Uncharacterized protein n=1 Tax=Viridothelium virens TaxID=1048519 RepID=A0A6A6GZ23_VIRVR|nr:hypothetical protein EV356DRAFT_322988 [Viridothelium virens]